MNGYNHEGEYMAKTLKKHSRKKNLNINYISHDNFNTLDFRSRYITDVGRLSEFRIHNNLAIVSDNQITFKDTKSDESIIKSTTIKNWREKVDDYV